MKIYIPHLDYTIITKPFKTDARVPNAISYVERIDASTAHLHLGTGTLAPSLAHEVVHILQYICNDRDIDFVQDQEHMGYLMQYILAELMELEYIKKV